MDERNSLVVLWMFDAKSEVSRWMDRMFRGGRDVESRRALAMLNFVSLFLGHHDASSISEQKPCVREYYAQLVCVLA
jgi:hypothetical protein